MIFFLAYALGAWYLVAQHRRTLAAALWLGATAIGVVVVAYIHYRLSVWTNGTFYLPVLRSFLYPYGIVVVLVGAYIALLPRARVRCVRCDHDLTELPRHARVCPSCGTARAFRAHGHKCAICKYDLSGLDQDHGVCPECGTLYSHRLERPVLCRGPQPMDELPPPSQGERAARRERFVREHTASDAH